MNNFDAHTIQLGQRLAQTYGQLPVLDQKIVQFFSVVYESIDRNTLLSCLNYINLCDTNRQFFSHTTLKPHLDRLLADGLLIHTPGEGIGCHPLLAEIATRDAVRSGWFETLATSVQEKIQVSRIFQQGPQYFRSQNQFLREVRIAIYRHKGEDLNRILDDYYKYNRSPGKISIDNIIEQIFNRPFDTDWFRSLPKTLSETALSAILLHSVVACSLIEEPFEYLRSECETTTDESSELLKLALTEQLLLRHYVEEARQVLKRISSFDNSALFWGWLHFLEGKNELAIEFYTKALKSFRKAKGVKQLYFGTIGGLFFILALLKDGSRDRLLEADKYATIIAEHQSHWLRSVYTQLKNLLQFQLGNLTYKDLIIKANIPTIQEQHSIETLFSLSVLGR